MSDHQPQSRIEREQRLISRMRAGLEAFCEREGKGADPALMHKLISDLDHVVYIHGWPAYQVVRDCVAAAKHAHSPYRYFAKSVTRRLRERGMYVSSAE